MVKKKSESHKRVGLQHEIEKENNAYGQFWFANWVQIFGPDSLNFSEHTFRLSF